MCITHYWPASLAVRVDAEVRIHDGDGHRLEVLNKVIKHPEPIRISTFSDLHTNAICSSSSIESLRHGHARGNAGPNFVWLAFSNIPK